MSRTYRGCLRNVVATLEEKHGGRRDYYSIQRVAYFDYKGACVITVVGFEDEVGAFVDELRQECDSARDGPWGIEHGIEIPASENGFCIGWVSAWDLTCKHEFDEHGMSRVCPHAAADACRECGRPLEPVVHGQEGHLPL